MNKRGQTPLFTMECVARADTLDAGRQRPLAAVALGETGDGGRVQRHAEPRAARDGHIPCRGR